MVSPLFLLPLQDDVMLDQGGLALAHPSNLRVRDDNTMRELKYRCARQKQLITHVISIHKNVRVDVSNSDSE